MTEREGAGSGKRLDDFKNKIYYIFSNSDKPALEAENIIRSGMSGAGWRESGERDEADIIFCIGGDGALLRLMRRSKFPKAPIIGINTGHLGFFQEIPAENAADLIELLETGNYHIQEYIGISADVYKPDGYGSNYIAINEIVIRGEGERLMHLDISIDNRFITRFSGDGVLICTPAGSTAYNYSLGGAIVDPDVEMLQITPMAPVNNTAYRSFSSGIILPSNKEIEIVPVESMFKNVVVIEDGGIVARGNVERIVIRRAERKARIIRFSDYDFWGKVKDKITG